MKGKIKITVAVEENSINPPIKRELTIEENNTFETIDEWVNTFKAILYWESFSPVLINEIFGEEDKQ